MDVASLAVIAVVVIGLVRARSAAGASAENSGATSGGGGLPAAGVVPSPAAGGPSQLAPPVRQLSPGEQVLGVTKTVAPIVSGVATLAGTLGTKAGALAATIGGALGITAGAVIATTISGVAVLAAIGVVIALVVNILGRDAQWISKGQYGRVVEMANEGEFILERLTGGRLRFMVDMNPESAVYGAVVGGVTFASRCNTDGYSTASAQKWIDDYCAAMSKLMSRRAMLEVLGAFLGRSAEDYKRHREWYLFRNWWSELRPPKIPELVNAGAKDVTAGVGISGSQAAWVVMVEMERRGHAMGGQRANLSVMETYELWGMDDWDTFRELWRNEFWVSAIGATGPTVAKLRAREWRSPFDTDFVVPANASV